MSPLRVQAAQGAIVFAEGDPPTTAFLVESGRISISTERDGEGLMLAEIGPGELLGEMAVIDRSPRTATATALTDCVLLAIDHEQISERLAQADPIIRALLEGQLKRYRSALAAMQGNVASGPEANPYLSEQLGIGKIRLESQLREALAAESLDLRLQPILDIDGDVIAGYEALVRWTHPTRGPISPAEFIALAEETSLILPVGEYVLGAAIQSLLALRDAGIQPLPFIAINVSARQLAADGLVRQIIEQMKRAGLPLAHIKVEITESQILDLEKVGAAMQSCREAGIRVSLDDFGTGYSNLHHLHMLRFDTVKIDQAFARSMVKSDAALAIVRAITRMARALEADIVVEGIETAEQLAMLKQLGCRYAQGYLIGRPQRLDDILRVGGLSPGGFASIAD